MAFDLNDNKQCVKDILVCVCVYIYIFSLALERQKAHMWDQVQVTQWIKIKSRLSEGQASKILA